MYHDHSVVNRLSRCTKDIYSWSRDHCNSLKKDIDDCRKQLCLSRNNNIGADQVQLLSLRKQMAKLLMQDDAYWSQRGRTHWYMDGDRNTNFFHASATTRKIVNCILSLEDDQSVKITDNPGMSTLAKNYFLDLFQRKNSNTTPMVNAIRRSITDIDNASLTAPFSKEEFRDAIFFDAPR